MRTVLCLAIVMLLFCGCGERQHAEMKQGDWLGKLYLMDDQILPFNFKLTKNGDAYFMEVYNANEVVTIDEISVDADSIHIKMPVFEGYIAGRFGESSITGDFIKESLKRVVPFKATYGKKPRFEQLRPAEVNVSGIWEAEFSANTEDSYMAKGIFTQNGDKVTGTFRTTTGDYRYLEGVVDADSLKLSTFDGAHAFLFAASISDSTLNGTFYSGNHFKEPFTGKRNEAFELPDEDSLTYLKEGFDRLEFSFPDASGKNVSLSDTQFKDKAVVVQIMGTWCPNCLDETKFLVEYLEQHDHPDFQVVALAFEYAKTPEKAFEGISRLRERIGVPYPILLAQFGTSNKVKANEKLPMLNHVLSYPTTIFLDKSGAVRKIHTGFNGPATGSKYTEFKKEFGDFVEVLLSE
ncbi:peroxiredoxin family protein [Poritiphilus flavus]|uniref:Redoxin domain-containing protein n=1 Tax=Poritiphilus flavus TaxID=2697053 RepID=A0A6L9EGP4_9FLAO|nr:TlpA disulfide reductase family protein [Poritiphilus flavus]NAS13429.1 redoxin domain-containing protein [Poritiphilus flavus]